MSKSATPFTNELTKLSRENAVVVDAFRTLKADNKALRDAFRSVNQQSQAVHDAFRAIDEQNQAVRDAFKDINEQNEPLGRVLRSVGEMRQQAVALVDAIRAPADMFRKLREENAAVLEALKIPRQDFAFLRDESANLRELIRPAMPADHLAELFHVSDVATDLFRAIRETSEAIQNQGMKTHEIFNVAREMAAQHHVRDWSEIFPQAQQFAAEAVERLNAVQAAVDSVRPVEPFPPESEPWRSVDDIEESFKKLPLHGQLLFLIVFMFFVRPLWDRAYTDFVLGEYGSPGVASERLEVAEVREVAEIAALRCVIADALNVRSSASKTAERIGALPRGHLVEVLERNGAWSYVRFRKPESDALDMGWVATGYLSRELCPQGRSRR